jgi:ribosomal protein S18 acetylase RimI-like enzyme
MAMFVLEAITPRNAQTFKSVRLQALKDSPLAFGSTYARESQLSDADWSRRAGEWTSPRAVGYLATYAGEACGICAAFLAEDDPRVAHLVSMWVAPQFRRSGLGRTLVEAIQSWAKTKGAQSVRLTVTHCNAAAIQFYKRLGFRMTGKTEPYPNDPALFEYEMSCRL